MKATDYIVIRRDLLVKLEYLNETTDDYTSKANALNEIKETSKELRELMEKSWNKGLITGGKNESAQYNALAKTVYLNREL